MPFNYKNEKKKFVLNKNCAQNKKHLFCMLYFVNVFYNMKCLKNIYFVCSFLLNMKLMLVFIFINFFSVLNFGTLKYESWFVPVQLHQQLISLSLHEVPKRDLNRM